MNFDEVREYLELLVSAERIPKPASCFLFGSDVHSGRTNEGLRFVSGWLKCGCCHVFMAIDYNGQETIIFNGRMRMN